MSPRKLSSSTVSSSGTIQSIENVLLVCKFEVAGRIEFKQVYSTIDISFNGLKRLLKVPVNSVLFYKDHYELISICEDEDLMFMFDKVVDGEVYIVVRSR